jgi:hypothetical protein
MGHEQGSHETVPGSRGVGPVTILGRVVLAILVLVLIVPMALGLLYGLIRPLFG